MISDALQSYADLIIEKLDDSLVDDYRNKFQALLDDLYTEEIVNETVVGAMVARTTNQAITANVPTLIIWSSGVSFGVPLWDSGDPTKLTIPSGLEGFWNISGTVLFAASTSSQKLIAIYVDGVRRYLQAITSANAFSMPYSYSFYSTGNDIVTVEVTSPTAVTITGNTPEAVVAQIVRVAAE